MKFEGDVPAFEAPCLVEIRASLRALRASWLEPLPETHRRRARRYVPHTAVVVTYRYKAEYEPIPRESLIWGEEPYFKPFTPFNDETWSDAGEQEAFLPLVHRA